MLNINEQIGEFKGFEQAKVLPGSTFHDNSTVIIVPTRGLIHHRVVSALQNLMAPMNQKRAILFAAGDEVGVAYNNLIKYILADPNLSKWKYILTLEDDNLPPPDAHIRLLESIKQFDVVSGLYFTKGEWCMPMAYGSASTFQQTGQLSFAPVECKEFISQGNIVETNGIGMGCALWRMDLFRELSDPWFVTLNDIVPDKGPAAMTQDLYFCEKLKRAGKRIAVDCRVKVGHLDVNTGVVY